MKTTGRWVGRVWRWMRTFGWLSLVANEWAKAGEAVCAVEFARRVQAVSCTSGVCSSILENVNGGPVRGRLYCTGRQR